jgi:hypothetical protein
MSELAEAVRERYDGDRKQFALGFAVTLPRHE